ncbi:pilus assembly protein PilC [Acinetobacter sp. ANC 5054]|uniref:pilus assembly protein PilC n=1 Tax=Acinetobacter sp. ANC 5054 TaxID=1977877 RepID=UPI000A33F367|nr:pilus assembly protein PilC [Acinetobacter sp. ANC 5054]OTG81405.1 pilus assembly protein PilC [Acinetobacter sp. ANC 5054]
MKKLYQKNILSASVSMMMTLALCQSVATQASDIDIYTNATGGQTSILLMLDTSGSMGISSLVMPKNYLWGSPGDVDGASLCSRTDVSETGSGTRNFKAWTYNLAGFQNSIPVKAETTSTNATAISKTVTIVNSENSNESTTITYYLRGCTNGVNWQYDRLSRLKDAIIPLLAGNDLSDKVVMGLGQFSAKTGLNVSGSELKLIDGHSGAILVKNHELDYGHRVELAKKVASFQSLDNKTYGNGRQKVSLGVDGESYISATSDTKYVSNILRKSSNLYPLGTKQYKTAGGTPAVQAYAEAGAYMMGTTTGVNNSHSSLTAIEWIYDGSMTMQNVNSPYDQVHFICVELTTGANALTSSDFKISGKANDVKQCINNWPSVDAGNKTVSTNVVNGVYQNSNQSGTVFRPDGNGGWIQIVGQTNFKNALKAAGVSSNGEMTSGWETLSKLPAGWRYGGWMKVDQEPLDIEPIVGKVWGPYANNSAYGIVAYRSNPFALVEKASTNLADSYTDNLVGGYRYSVENSKNISTGKYHPAGSANTCNGNGIYFLTDGAPNSTKDNMAQAIMNTTLSSVDYEFKGKPSGTGTLISPRLKSNLFSGETGGWEYIGEYSKKILDPTKNPGRMKIKTAVVGFGSSFSGLTKNTDDTYNCASAPNDDAKNACLWGSSAYGDGGFYYAEDADDIKNSIIKFVTNVTPDFEPIATGSPTLPQDALNPLTIQPYGYYASFTPKPQAEYRLWMGNLNKYNIHNGQLYNSSNTIKLIKDDGSLNSNANGLWSGGVLGQLALGTALNSESEAYVRRTIFTNREISSSTPYTANETNSLKELNVNALFGTGTNASFVNDPQKNYWLNLLGYNVAANATGITLNSLSSATELRQFGTVMHSTPILLTQRGAIKVDVATGALDTTDRDDYLLFGSSQGLLHVVDVKTGKEKFAFAPHEMMERQRDAFLAEKSTTGGSANLFYGIDAPWTAYTQYVSKEDGSLTVQTSDKTSDGGTNTDLALKGLQWVYGGLRMGGNSYYALDLTNLDKPSLKFHIDPKLTGSKIYKSGSTVSVEALDYMGQSWSKPTLAYVNFGGEKRPVMFVGGGYDAGYEAADYNQTTTNGGGAGVYMFDADTGDLLWWTSANATKALGAQAFTDASDANINMKYSVVSQINAVDRDNDGLVDNLYFGDLAGQGFRVDLNNLATGTDENAKKANFAKRVVRLFDEHAAGGASPRFYEMPSVSIHESNNGYIAAVAFSSGNRSKPLVGATGTNHNGSTVSADDGVFVVYDKDVAKPALYDELTLVTNNIALESLNHVMDDGVPVADNDGWKYTYSDKAGVYKGMNELYALDSMLYVNVFHRDGTGIGGNCGAGVKGDSYVYQFCLPTGKCPFATTTSGEPNKVKIGAGILGSGLGLGHNNNKDNTGLVVPRPGSVDCEVTANKNLPECQLFSTTANLRQLRWYETR